jgi:aspartyl-tRNA(Asn)/glutamyl-tRNA(Gln) amidotransferase subunit A
MKDDVTRLSGAQIAHQVKSKKLSAVETVKRFLERADKIGPELNTWITLDHEGALRDARSVDNAVAQGKPLGPLAGVPVGLKDLIDTAGIRTTAGSQIYRDRIPAEDAPIVKKIRDSGAVILGKLNLHEFAFGPTGHNPHYGDQKNPWDTERVTGGSSGGSGNAVATAQASITIGSDTGGSIRIPASLCGTICHKPTFGLVTKASCFPLSWSLDSFGPLATSAEDCALMMSAIAGPDPLDSSSLQFFNDTATTEIYTPLRGLRIGHARSYYAGQSEPEVVKAMEEVAYMLNEEGALVIEVDIPDLELAYDACTTFMLAEAAAVHEKHLRKHADEIDPWVVERTRAGFFIPATAYIQAQRFRGQWAKRVLKEVFEKVDFVISAATPVPAPLRSAEKVTVNGKEYGARLHLIALTRHINFLGMPSTGFPIGFNSEGLPLGGQLIGPPCQDHRTLAAVHQMEKKGAISTKIAPFGD